MQTREYNKDIKMKLGIVIVLIAPLVHLYLLSSTSGWQVLGFICPQPFLPGMEGIASALSLKSSFNLALPSFLFKYKIFYYFTWHRNSENYYSQKIRCAEALKV